VKIELPEERWNALIQVRRIAAKAIFYVITDVEGRSLGEREGLDTLVVLGENDECHRLFNSL
jgi:hypothetical protein